MARLIVKTEDGSNTVEMTPGTTVHIGRESTNEVAVPDARGASRKHCQLTSVPSSGGSVSWELTDLGATNKTRVNGKSVDKCVLASGDVLGIGSAEITFEDAAEEAHLKEAGAKGVCYIEWVSGDRKGEKVWLEGARTTLGRRESNSIPLDDRMSSGHHAEITKDLNGYTIRDLGSTNGTLVNGEPTTEAPLTHGTRIRIGNSRLAFKDPSMKDVEIELSQFDEDEGWGMMGDIDLSRARGSYVGLVLALLFVGLAAAGLWYFTTQADLESTGEGPAADRNLVDVGDMEDKEAVGILWSAAKEGDPVSVSAGGGKLKVRYRAGQEGGEKQTRRAFAVYASELPARTADPLRVRANLRANGDAALVVIWRNWRDPEIAAASDDEFEEAAPAATVVAGGGTRVSHTVSLGSGRIDALAVKPHWALSMQVAVRVGPEGSATLDDLEITADSASDSQAVEVPCPGDCDAYLNASGDIDIVNGLTVLVVGAGPAVRLADGTVLTEFVADALPGAAEAGGTGALKVEGHFVHGEKNVPVSITWSQMGEKEGLRADVQCAAAEAVGLSTRFVRPHLEQGLNVLTVEKAGSISAAAGQTIEGVRKTLGGEPRAVGGRPRTLVTLAPGGEAGASTLELHDADDGMLLDLRHMTLGTSAVVDMITNYEVQSRLALEALTSAERKVRTHPGLGIEMLREVALLFPFVESVHEKATALARKAEVDARAEVTEYGKALHEFKVFRSKGTLANLDKKTAAMGERYPDRGASNGTLETDVAAINVEGAEARSDYYGEHAGSELARLERLADLLAEVEGYEPMAAIFYRTIVDRFGHLGGADSFGRRVERAQKRYEELVKDPEVGSAVPALPK